MTYGRRLVVLLGIFALYFSCSVSGVAQSNQKDVLRIFMLSGSKEYQSNTSLAAWKKRLESKYRVRCFLSKGADRAKKIDGVKHLKHADLLVLFNRRYELKKKYWNPLRSYIQSDRPILGIRTASHAFDRNFPTFDREVLGADYHGHHDREQVKVDFADGVSDHPILDGVRSWMREGKLYLNKDFDASTEVLLVASGVNSNHGQPVAWTHTIEEKRIFYTPMGLPHDFENEMFLRLLENAVNWTTRGELKKAKE